MSVIGLDVGTSRVKAVRFDEQWRAADVEAEDSVVRRNVDGTREQDPDEVWTIAARVLSAVTGRSPDPVELVSVTGQGDGCWLVDDAGRPAGPALLWNDSRAADIIGDWERDGRLTTAFRRNGCQGAPGLAHAQLVWLQRHRPETLESAATLLSCGSWVYLRLTGRRVLEATEAANPFFDAAEGAYDPTLLDLFGIADLERLLPEVVDGADRVAPVLDAVADQLGLAHGTPVSIAPYDVPATAIGTGATSTGLSFGVLGTTLCVGTVADDPRLDRAPNGMTLPGAGPGRWLIAYATMVGTEVLDWAARLLGLADARAVVELAGGSTRTVPPLVLPYLSVAGERSPFLDSRVRGTVTGLDTGHTPADLARGVLDGLTLVVRDCLAAAGLPDSLALSGGGSASTTWCQNISDATGVPVTTPDVGEVGARGAVICGAADLGRFDDVDQAVAAAVGTGTTFTPDRERTAYFDDAYERFVGARELLRSGEQTARG
ncbi:FGGY family carbohydrate kinase [uncultured Jatrophihabitans sp.]|uniref:FGGY family carbohydrate kinase n=1 Tax=uncultured Jatrophihabitans sp. TaxID=1610747 RepID=UPI0035CBAA0E